MDRAAVAVLVVGAAVATLTGCSTGRLAESGAESAPEVKIKAEAFLFDARLRRHGKPTSVRLELYYTDSLTGMSGRGYLGKGALKGWVSDDSLEAYFPTTNEYVYEPIRALLKSDDCTGRIPNLPLGRLLVTTPDSIGPLGDVKLAADYSDHNHPTFGLHVPGCAWRIDVTYDWHDQGWRVMKFFFDDGDSTTLTATRRTLRSGAEVPLHRFQASVPPDASRIIP